MQHVFHKTGFKRKEQEHKTTRIVGPCRPKTILPPICAPSCTLAQTTAILPHAPLITHMPLPLHGAYHYWGLHEGAWDSIPYTKTLHRDSW